ncbi:MAG TPA: APC family permease [Blastocatellia bacterium]|nr:APC family permease [Blastocatellia bacterium]
MAEDLTEATAELRDAEQQVERRSAVFKKELGLTDLALTQILFIIGLPWVGVAGKLGPSHVIFWVLAIALFYLPSAAVVIYLNRLMPLEGGLYQWAKLGFNSLMGFMVAWNLWLFVILNCSEIGLQAATSLSYAIGPRGAWIAGSKWFISLLSSLIIGLLVLVSILGLGVGKWFHKAGGVTMLLTFALLIALPILNYTRGTIDQYQPLATEMPAVSLFSLNILGKLGFGALGGFEYVAIHAGECRDPVRTIGRSVLVAAPLIAVMFILGTSSVLSLIAPEDIDLIGPIPQVMRVGFGKLGFAAGIVPVAIVAFLGIRIAQSSVQFAGNTRLPMVAGWDRLLPEWFTRLHAKRKTPVNSILFVGAMTLAMGLVGLIGVGEQEAFQLLWNASGIFYALTYLVMFAIPLAGLKGTAERAPLWLKLASASGLLMTLLYVTLSILPVIKVESRFAFAAKIASVIVAANLIGAVLFLVAERRRSRETVASDNAVVD